MSNFINVGRKSLIGCWLYNLYINNGIEQSIFRKFQAWRFQVEIYENLS